MHDFGRCRNFCQCASRATCFLFGGRDLVDDIVGDYGQVARALADYFEDGGVLDIVASDIAAGFMMLQKEQRLRLLEVREEIMEETRHKNVKMSIEGIPSRASSSTSFHSALSEVQPTFISERLDSDHELEDSFTNTRASLFKDQAMLDSALSPFPFSSMFVLPDGPTDMLSLDNWNHTSSVFTLKMNANNEEMSPRYEAHERKVFNRNNEYDRAVIAEGARFSRHALSIYSWMLLVYMEPIKSFPKLTYHRLKDCFQGKSVKEDLNGEPYNFFSASSSNNNVDTDNVLGDNWFHIHRNSLLAHSGLDQSDLIYANFSNKYNHMPYCIVIDHKWQR